MLTIFLCVFLSACFVLAMRVRSKTNAYKLPPVYPSALPIIGHAHLLISDGNELWKRIQKAAEYTAKQGGVSYIMLGSHVYYLITDTEDALTASNACLQKHFAFDFGKPWLGDGLLTGSGEIWKHHRKLLYPAFGLPVLHGLLGVFNSQARKLCSAVKPHAGKGAFDHNEMLRYIALETFCLGTFGLIVAEDIGFTKRYLDAADMALNMVTDRFTKFWLHSDLVYGLSGLKKKEQVVVETLHSMSDEVLQRKRATLKKGLPIKNTNDDNCGTKYKSFMDLLLDLSADGTLSDKEIREEMDTLISAGFETTSNQLLFILMLLGAHANVQNKMLEELIEVLGPERDVEKEDLPQLMYTNAVIMESLRMLPSAPIIARHVDKDVKLKHYTMRSGSQCILFPLANHRDAAWGPDCHQFRPERWLDLDLSGSKEFAGFGLGRRACIGRQYAMISMKVFLSHFIRQYSITADMNQLKLKCIFVLKPVSGHEIAIEKRIY